MIGFLRYNKHTAKLTFEAYNSMFFKYIYKVLNHHHLFQNILISPEINSIPFNRHSLSPHSLVLPTTDLLSDFVCLPVLDIHINGIIQYMVNGTSLQWAVLPVYVTLTKIGPIQSVFHKETTFLGNCYYNSSNQVGSLGTHHHH